MTTEERRDVHKRRPATTTVSAEVSDVSGDSDREEEEEEGTAGIGVLDVIKAIAPLLVIIGLALGMLLFGYLFVPETLSSQNFQSPPSTSSNEPTAQPPSSSREEQSCSVIGGAKPLIKALKDFSRWRELGVALHLSPDHLDTIERVNEEAELRKRAVLRAWLGGAGSGVGGVCWENLLEALEGLGESPLARDVAGANGVHWDFSNGV